MSKPLSTKMRTTLAAIADNGAGSGIDVIAPLGTLRALEARGLCKTHEYYWGDDPRPAYYATVTSKGRKLAAERA